MSLRIFNTKTMRKEAFSPKRDVKMYICGPTVYDYCHIGHARSYVAFDLVRRYLEAKGYRVRFVQNFTDVADEINKRAMEVGVEPEALAERFIKEYFRDIDRLGIKRADAYPRVSENIKGIIAAGEKLLNKGAAYRNGCEIQFDTSRVPGYGSLSRLSMEELLKGAKAEVTKKSPLDFAIWKEAKKGEACWDSPWCCGRPGWHIQCYVMASKTLGLPLDIHGGGLDLVFPHHENSQQIAVASDGKEFSRFFMHNGFLTMGRKKMSKSAGHFIKLRELYKDFDGDTVRFFLLSVPYRSNLEFDEKALRKAKKEITDIRKALNVLKARVRPSNHSNRSSQLEKEVCILKRDFCKAMDDDFDTGKAESVVIRFARRAMALKGDCVQSGRAAEELGLCLDILGIKH